MDKMREYDVYENKGLQQDNGILIPNSSIQYQSVQVSTWEETGICGLTHLTGENRWTKAG